MDIWSPASATCDAAVVLVLGVVRAVELEHAVARVPAHRDLRTYARLPTGQQANGHGLSNKMINIQTVCGDGTSRRLWGEF